MVLAKDKLTILYTDIDILNEIEDILKTLNVILYFDKHKISYPNNFCNDLADIIEQSFYGGQKCFI